MFAPPPVQLSRAEIETRISARRKSSIAGGPLTKSRSASSGEEQDRGSLHGSTSPTSPRPTRVSNTDRIKVSPSVISPSRLSLEHRTSGALTVNGADSAVPRSLFDSFAERPRKAPVPPKRSTAPPDGWFTQSRTSTLPPHDGSGPDVPSQSPPLIPAKSPKRKTRARPPSYILRSLHDDPFNGVGAFSESISKFKAKDVVSKAESERPIHPLRVHTAPAATTFPSPSMPTTESRTRAASTRSGAINYADLDSRASTTLRIDSRLSGVRGSRIDKSSKRMSTESAMRAALLDLDELYSFAWPTTPPSKTSEGQVNTRLSSLPDIQFPWRRQRTGETYPKLLKSGFFPVGSLPGQSYQNAAIAINVPSPIAFLSKDLPPTPTSVVGTPTELYLKGPLRPTRPTVRPRKQVNRKRSPLSHLSKANVIAKGSVFNAALSPGHLSAIPENAIRSENSPLSSGESTPVATQIHLPGGSVVTVCPPELTAWQRCVYIQGPIKLPKPVILPRKNSVASLEPFQDAIDHVYQEALSIPRRRSDEQVVDDVCEFFDDFGFDEVAFDGDVLGVQDTLEGARCEADDYTEDGIERFSTPPAEPGITPLEKVVAQEIVELMSKSLPPPIPAVKDQESLRVRGIASLSRRPAANAWSSHHGRKDSVTLDKPGSLHFLPIPEEAAHDAIPKPFRTEHHIVVKDYALPQTLVSTDDIQEMDISSPWVMAETGTSRRTGSVKVAQDL